jgi:hypothetical protein
MDGQDYSLHKSGKGCMDEPSAAKTMYFGKAAFAQGVAYDDCNWHML